MNKIKKVFKSGLVITLLIFLFIAVYAIHPSLSSDGVAIRSVVENSSASLAGIESPKPNAPPMRREVVTEVIINNQKTKITDVKSYYESISNIGANDNVRVVTKSSTYQLSPKVITETQLTGEVIEVEVPISEEITFEINGTNVTEVVYLTENVTEYVEVIDEETNETTQELLTFEKNITETKLVNETEIVIVGVEDLGLNVYDAPTTNLRKGLDLQGGTRVLLEPEEELGEDDMEILKLNMEKRLNIYGLSDISIRIVRDKPVILGGKPKYMLVEIPGANENEVKDLLSKQGKFEAKVGNATVFKGGSDITYVCRTADCSGIDPNVGCSQSAAGWGCGFRFSISLSPEAAQRQADATADVEIITSENSRNQYLAEPLSLYLDDSLVDQLNIAADLAGKAVTDISISGGGQGSNQQEALYNTVNNMKRLQTILITGSLPVKLNVVKTDNISPVLGKQFVQNSIMVGLIVLLAVTLVIFIRYRKLEIAIPMFLALLSEVVLLLGFAAFIGWNMDIAAIAGILITAGTGVDHLIVISDEALQGLNHAYINWKEKFKRAFSIVLVAFFTTAVAMAFLWFAGAGLLKGFAFTTLAGLCFGVFLVRPAFAKVVEILLK